MAVTEFARPLLTPEVVQRRSLYSMRAVFVTSLLGGLFGAVLMSALNSRRVGRLWRDMPLYAGLSCLWVLAQICLHHFLPGPGEREAQVGLLELRLLESLVAFTLCFRLHRALHRAQEVTGRRGPNGEATGFLVVLLGTLLHGVVARTAE